MFSGAGQPCSFSARHREPGADGAGGRLVSRQDQKALSQGRLLGYLRVRALTGRWGKDHPGFFCSSTLGAVKRPDLNSVLSCSVHGYFLPLLYTWPLSEPASQPEQMKAGRTLRNPPLPMQLVSLQAEMSLKVSGPLPPLPSHCDREHRGTQDLPQQTPQKHAHSSVTWEARHFLGKETSPLLFEAPLR